MHIVLLAGGVVFGRVVRVGLLGCTVRVRYGVGVAALLFFGTRCHDHGLLGSASPTVVRSSRILF